MILYVVSIVDGKEYFLTYTEVHYASSYANAIKFLEIAIKDDFSGIDEDTIIDIATDVVDYYFDKRCKSAERKTAREFLEDGVDTSEAWCIIEEERGE